MRHKTEMGLYALAAAAGVGIFLLYAGWTETPRTTASKPPAQVPLTVQRAAKSKPSPATPSRSTENSSVGKTTKKRKTARSSAGKTNRIKKRTEVGFSASADSPFAAVASGKRPNNLGVRPSEFSSADAPQTKEELDQVFKKFLLSRGLSTQAFHDGRTSTGTEPIQSPESSDPGNAAENQRSTPSSQQNGGNSTVPSAGADEESSETGGTGDPDEQEGNELFLDRYSVEDAKVQENGEVWVQVGDAQMGSDAMEEMMSDAAGKYGDSSGPVRVVIWSGDQVRKVKTFFGDPMF